MAEAQVEIVTPEIVEEIIEAVEAIKPVLDTEEQKTSEPVAAEETAEQVEEKRKQKSRDHERRRLERQKTGRIQAETEAKLLRERVAELEARISKPQENTEPQREQFNDYEDYIKAGAEWRANKKVDERLNAERERVEANERQSKARSNDDDLAKTWIENEKTFLSANKDYEDVVAPFVEDELGLLQDGARRLILSSKVGPNLLYHLASNPEVAERISEFSSIRQIAELGKLEEKLTAPAKKTSSAPAPANHVNTAKTGSKDPAKMNQVEFRAWMKASGCRWG